MRSISLATRLVRRINLKALKVTEASLLAHLRIACLRSSPIQSKMSASPMLIVAKIGSSRIIMVSHQINDELVIIKNARPNQLLRINCFALIRITSIFCYPTILRKDHTAPSLCSVALFHQIFDEFLSPILYESTPIYFAIVCNFAITAVPTKGRLFTFLKRENS